MITIGIDIGSVAAKGVIVTNNAQHRAIIPTGWSPRDAGGQLVDILVEKAKISSFDIDNITVTGYGRVALDIADKKFTEISCHARGVAELCPKVRTIVDIGGQDSKVIHIDSKGKVLDFAMNDKCAAGTGKFLQVMATAMSIDVSDLGDFENQAELVPINNMCTVFAESEIIGLMAKGSSKSGIIAGLHQSVAKRTAAMTKRMGIKGEVALTGGVALNKGVQLALIQELGCEVIIPELCQYTGALGAALLGRNVS
ncbi:hypothetical protein SYNTR_0051 [Candidatus Syntrophocurvum alkaliphilum]|uniref:ATPase BadF/BadG/BcrA/BcrD type domain-containing protein n=1 Tax=Candidatus Syntrophocurvum alkaliphilum TaxID=2293317 RepID=A0A6I6DAV5_9FIRM|nr:acyl-CoA dehydratase activase [Candidatus Syntrophocurvum alkaliphilum]QGT98644.1 hypothetical protein SYNTR_0051 [Candidatus Syntrophocurvum alkaliphilum]